MVYLYHSIFGIVVDQCCFDGIYVCEFDGMIHHDCDIVSNRFNKPPKILMQSKKHVSHYT